MPRIATKEVVPVLSQIAVYPNNRAAFPSYGVQYFDDLNDAWASIPRANNSYAQNCNDWVVQIPGGIYTPASDVLAVYGTAVNGQSYLLDWGYTGQGCVGQEVTGPGLPPGTTVTGISMINGIFYGAGVCTFTAGNPVVASASTAGLFVGMTVFSGSGALVLPYTHITAINPGVSFTVADAPTANSITVSLTGSPSVVATLSAACTADHRDAQYQVTVPLKFVGSTNSSTSLTGCSYGCTAMVGKKISGTDIPANTRVTAVAYNATTNVWTLTLDTAATGTTAGVTFTIEKLPSVLYCDTHHRRIANVVTGPVTLGNATGSSGQGAQFWTPQPGFDHFIDLHLGMGTSPTIYGMRTGWRWDALDEHSESLTTHEAYPAKSRLSGTLVMLDPMVGGSPNQHLSLGDLEVFGNPGRNLATQQPGSTVNLSTTLTVTSTSNLWPGMGISGPGVQAGTVISSILTGNTLAMSLAATSTNGPGVGPAVDPSYAFTHGVIVQTIQTGTTTKDSTSVTTLTSTVNLYPGQPVSGTNIQAGTYVQAITSLTALTLTKPATGNGAVSLTFAPTVISFDGSLLSATTSNFKSVYKSRFRSTVLGMSHWELGLAEHSEWSACAFYLATCHVEACTFKGGMVWTANSTNFDAPGFYGCQVSGTSAWNGPTAAPLRMDTATNYWFMSQGAYQGATTLRVVQADPSAGRYFASGVGATIATTTIYAPPVTGLFRLSTYAVCTTAGTGGTATPTVGWRDDVAAQTAALAAVNLTVPGSYTSDTRAIRNINNQPITIALLIAGVVGSPLCTVHCTVEPID